MESRSLNVSGFDHLREQGHSKNVGQKREALKQAAKEFESVFMYQVVQAMRQTIPKGGLVEKGEGEEMFEGMLDQEWAKTLAGRGGPASLSEVIYRQLSRAAGLEEEGAATGAQTVTALPPANLVTPPAPGTAKVGKMGL